MLPLQGYRVLTVTPAIVGPRASQVLLALRRAGSALRKAP